jgi:type IV pilus assembly protein PilC
LKKALALEAKVKSALVYPGVIVSVAFVLIAFLMVFVIPSFAAMFSKGGAELPWPTVVVMDVSNFFRFGWYYMITGFVAFVFIF